MTDRNHGYDFVYLKNTVGAPLAEALAQVALDQPDDPIEFVGSYLLKHVANERQRTERMIQSRVHKTEADFAAEEAAKKVAAAQKVKDDLNAAILADSATREELLSASDWDVLCRVGMTKLAAATQAEACYLGRRVADADGANFIQWFAATDSSKCVVDKFVGEETGFTFDVLKEVEVDPPEVDADGNSIPPAIPPFIHVENVIREPRIKYFGIPRMGAYLVKGIKYNSFLHDDVVQGDSMPAVESWLIVAVDTLGAARPFTPDNIREFLKWSLTLGEAVELYEKRTAVAQIELRKVDERDVKTKLDAIKDTLAANDTRVANAVEGIEDEARKAFEEATVKAQLINDLLVAQLDALHIVGTSLIPFKAPVLKTLAAGLVLLGNGFSKRDTVNAATQMPSWDKIRPWLVNTVLAPKVQAFQVSAVSVATVAQAREVLGDVVADDVELPAPSILVLHTWIQTMCAAADVLEEARVRAENPDE
ncbi:hypothetical protein H310_15251 [Aphanomyces invadans]|uniref:Uncharacterized protein n=1 Tax=Aphanomyces invadans TaxID=157072 RepID=A0A024T9C8_9STRA|nr:hypothetical protein H310_15251 [Aphanomyces invadans]ETV89907.1 hypothetical protein H310_15251 [Aphanomyces invadans]|eukprot:XP_008881460.1 hypothetical protein H310_15251 [Aphanomyces invadans]